MRARLEAAKELFRIITPMDFRKEVQYIRKGYLHPKNVPEGRESEYLIKVSAILGADESIYEKDYVTTMHMINSMLTKPIDIEWLMDTICIPMMEECAKIDGVVVWQYNADWKSRHNSDLVCEMINCYEESKFHSLV